MFTTVLTSGMLSRPTQAVFLNSVVGCLLNIGTCTAPKDLGSLPNVELPIDDVDPGDDTPQEDTPNDDPDESPSSDEDVESPIATLAADPVLAGGNTQTVTITGTVKDENLTSYVLMLNGNVVQEQNDITETEATISVPWDVAMPNKVPTGMYKFTLDATDKAGNTVNVEASVEVDNDGPVVSLEGGDVIIKSGSITPSVTAEDSHDVSAYYWTADEDNPGILEYDANAPEPTFTPYVEGSYIFYANVTDGLGNVSTTPFNFGYARQLEPVPLLTTEDLSGKLITQGTLTPAVTPASANPGSSSDGDNNDESAVLGNTIVVPTEKAPVAVIAAISPTRSGWSILGVLWYWWLAAAGLVFAAWIVMKKFVTSRVPEHS